MISRTAFCSAQAAVMRLARTRTDAVNLTQSVRRRLNNIEHPLAEGAQELLGVGRADASNHAGGEVLLDAVGRGRGRCAQEPRLELLAVCSIVDPFT